MEIIGEIKTIVFQNEITGYTIADMNKEKSEHKKEDLITIVGYMPFVVEGDTLKIYGDFTEHRKYGRQFEVKLFEKLMPRSLGALERYLGSGLIKGIGKATAGKIVKMFGDDTISIIKSEPKKLSLIKGITKEKALEISEIFTQNWEVWKIVEYLGKIGIGPEAAKRVYESLGIDAIKKVENNPYILIDILRGLDFKKIDIIAVNMGILPDSDKRIRCGIKYALINITYNGHCCTLKDNLIEYTKNLLSVSEEVIENNIINLKIEGEIIEEKRDDDNIWIYLQTFYNTEMNIAKRINFLNNSKNIKFVENIDNELEKIEILDMINLSDKQKEAIKAVNENNITLITGGPGTGKTTIIKSIINIYEKSKYKVVLTAPTGRAAKRMSETTGKEASTLHRLLDIGKIDDEISAKYESDYQVSPIDADIIIVDEMSMVDMFLMNYLLKAIYKGSKLILVGDSDQLPSVGPGNVLSDLIKSEVFSTIHLDKVFRQAARSNIIVNAHRVNEGEDFISKSEMVEDAKNDFFMINETDQNNMSQQLISLCTGRLKNYGNYDFFQNIQILTPTKKGMFGTKELNVKIQNVLNPKMRGKSERTINGVVYRVGDRIMQVKNNYDIYWENEYENGTGVFNGEIGKITSIDELSRKVEIKFDDNKIVLYKYSEMDQIEHSYAITIHKSQGSEYDVVIMCIPNAAPILLTRNLLYTGITRAKELLIIIGSKNVVDFMIKNVDSKKRHTGLKYKLKGGLFE